VTVPPEGLDYNVQSGDTLLAIGLRYGLPWERIAEANGLDETSLLQIGQVVRVPGSGAPAAPPPPDVETEAYTVQPNDTLYTIAARRDMYWDEVASVNGFGEHTVLQIGQVIQVPVVEEEITPETTLLVSTRQGPVGPVAAGDFNSYTLTQFNGGQPVQASPGTGGPASDVAQVAMVGSEGEGATAVVLAQHAAQAEEPALYVVEPGDTVISIAVKHNLEWGPLLALNGLSEDTVLQLGQTIRLR
jgi:LysM repeat protein